MTARNILDQIDRDGSASIRLNSLEFFTISAVMSGRPALVSFMEKLQRYGQPVELRQYDCVYQELLATCEIDHPLNLMRSLG
jgi:hypothetical protein